MILLKIKGTKSIEIEVTEKELAEGLLEYFNKKIGNRLSIYDVNGIMRDDNGLFTWVSCYHNDVERNQLTNDENMIKVIDVIKLLVNEKQYRF